MGIAEAGDSGASESGQGGGDRFDLGGQGGSSGTGDAAAAGQGGTAGSGTSGAGGGGQAGSVWNEAGHGGAGAAGGFGGNGGAGQGGEVGTCDAADTAFCDDGNGCTADACDPTQGCTHAALADDTPCTDGDVCTDGDRCVEGVCVGERRTSQAEVLGRIDSFSAYQERDHPEFSQATFQGIAAVLDGNRVVLAEPDDQGLVLHLLESTSSGVKELDRRVSYARLVSIGSGGLWGDELGTHWIVLGPNRVALVASRHAIEIYDIVGDRLTFRGYRYLGDDSVTHVWGGAGRGERLWIGDGMRVHAYTIPSDGTPTYLTSVGPLHFFESLASSDDGETLFVGGQFGVRTIDVSDVMHPVVADTPVIPEPRESRAKHLAVSGDYLLVQSNKLYVEIGQARLFRISDWSLIHTFPSERFVSMPFGAAFVDGGLLLQRIRYTAQQPSALEVELHRLAGDSVELMDVWRYRDLGALDNRRTWLPAPPAAGGALGVLGPTLRVVTTENRRIRELTSPLQGTFERVLPGGVGRVAAYGVDSSHWIDVTDPRAPAVLAGGLLAPGTTRLLRISAGTDGTPPVLLNLAEPWFPDGAHFTEFATDGAHAPQPTRSFQLTPSGSFVRLVSSGGLLFRAPIDEGGKRSVLEVFALPGSADTPSPLAPIETIALPEAARSLGSPQLAADTSAGSVLFIGSDAEREWRATLFWLARGAEGWVTAEHVELQGSLSLGGFAGMSGDRALIVTEGGRRLDLVLRRGHQVSVVRTRNLSVEGTGNQRFTALLGFDGELAYLATQDESAIPGVPESGIVALDLDDLSERVRYSVPQSFTSMAALDGTLVFGSRTTLLTASPECSPVN